MKVALINDKLNAGGAEKVLVYIANMLHENGVDVRVILLLNEAALDKEINEAVPIHYLQRKSRFDFKAFRKLKNLLLDVDIVHVHSRYNLRYLMVAKWFVKIAHPKIVFHEHVPSFSLDRFTKYLFGKVNAYVAVDDRMRKWVVEKQMVSSDRAFCLSNSVQPPSHKILFEEGSSKIIMVSNFRPQKNHFFAVDVLEQLPQQYTLDFYGMIDDAAYYEQVIKYISSKNLNNRIKIIHGISNVYEVLGKYIMAIHTAHAETGPLVLIEYLYAGIPFLASKTGEVVNQIKDILPEFIAEDFDVNHWSNRIDSLLNYSSFDNEKVEMCIRDFYSKNSYYHKLIAIYNQV